MSGDVLSAVIAACEKYKDLEWCFLTPTCIEVVRTNFVVHSDPYRPLRPVRLLASEEKIILEQEHVIAELNEHINPVTGQKPQDAESVQAVVDYLVALQKLFDFGLLSKEKLGEGDSSVIDNIRHGMAFFYDWLKGLLDKNPDFQPAHAKQKLFLSWQTWDLLRIAAYGFTGLRAEFAIQCPGEYFYPVKVNGSSVETLFSQMKFSSAGKLSGANYAQARRNLLMKSDVHGPRGSRGDYRRAPLAVANEDLKQVKRKKHPV